jgi:3-oxoacyl-[acyl-carrier protein] reductase
VELAKAGCTVLINGRDQAKLEQARREIAAVARAEVIAVAADLNTAEGRAALVDRAPVVDILVNNNGGPPFVDFREVDDAAFQAGVQANMRTPIALVQNLVDGMVERRFGRIVNITSGSVKMPMAGLDLSSGARAGLTAFLAGVARTVAHANVTINHLLPGSFDTRRLRAGQRAAAARAGGSPEAVEAAALAAIPAHRFGRPEEFGAMCAFLCSAQAGFVTGQSVLLDGGAYPGTF